MRRVRKPFVLMNCGMSLDGKISSVGGDSSISCEEELVELHKLRCSFDCILIGIGTLLKDDPLLTVRRVPCENRPKRVIVDTRLRFPTNARMLSSEGEIIVLAGSRYPEEKYSLLEEMGVKVITCREVDGRVDLRDGLVKLSRIGIESILLEGGGELNWSMLSSGLVDEVRVSIAPVILGGRGAKTLVEGDGFAEVSKGIELDLIEYKRVGRDLVLRYRVLRPRDEYLEVTG